MTLITDPEEFDALFSSFNLTADRLEVLDRYRSDLEDEVVRRYVAGEPDDLAWSQAWFAKIRKATAEGKRYRRVRVVTVPLSDYQECGVVRITPHNIEAGEDIRYLDRAEAGDLPKQDYWLFDAGTPTAKVATLHFDKTDVYLGTEVTAAGATELAAAFETAFARALPASLFAEVHGLG